MDDTTRLVSELLGKLAELDYKVNEYRHEMAQEFQRYSHQLLQHVPGPVRAEVEKVMASKMQNYPALNLGRFPALDSPSTDDTHNTLRDSNLGSLGSGRVTPPPTLPDPSSDLASDDTPRSPHERDREFIGLFTPSYLPLLDAVQRPTPTQTPKPSSTTTTPATPTSPFQSPKTKQPNGNQGLSSPSLADFTLRPDPVRRSTGDTVSSVTSDESVSRTRRSALRRSSSSSNKPQSPRRVRFDVEGEEVLPTASPPISPRISDLPSFSQNSPTRILDDSFGEIVLDDEAGLLGSSPPQPKKLTSTDRLKAMARSSNEDTSTWTVVDNSQGLSDDDDELVIPSLNGHSQAMTTSSSAKGGAVQRINDSRPSVQTNPSLEVVHETEEDQLAGNDDEMSDILEMPALSSFKGKKRFSPPKGSKAGTEHQGPKCQEQNSSHVPDTTDEEDMFHFDDGRDSPSDGDDRAKEASKYLEEEEDEDEDEDEDEGEVTPIAEGQPENSTAALYSKSPGVQIARPPPPSPASALSKQVAASAGSYKGRSFSIGIVRDQELHKRAAEMGDLYSFVGSVDGRSGVDESSSYRPEPSSFNGTPRSLSERLLMEELEVAHRNAGMEKRD